MRRLIRLAAVASTALALVAPTLVSAADHLDGTAVSANGAADINDIYAFAGADASNTVLVMTVNPAAGVISGTTFDPAVDYRFLVDTDGDAVEDSTLTVTFEAASGGSQAYSVDRDGTTIATGTTGTPASIDGGGQAWAGLADDPFFFDLEGFRQLKQTLLDAGTLEDAISLICDTDPDVNFFAGFDGSAIVLEMPDAALGGEIAIWAETLVDGNQVDRMGKPGINTVFITGDPEKDAFNAAEPMDDPADYTDEVVGITSAIQQALGVDAATADAYGATVAGILLPDVLPYNTAEAADFSAFNGRGLADDVIDVYYSVLTTVDGTPALTSDCVANDSAFGGAFPYLAAANGAGEPAPSAAPSMPNTGVSEPTSGSSTSLVLAMAIALIVSGIGLGVATARGRSQRG
jgi:hypothetical protein